MAHIINTIEELQKYISVSGSLDFDLILPYVAKAERRYIHPVVTAGEFENIIQATSGTKATVREILADATANFALLLAMPIISVDFSNTGITVADNDRVKQAKWWQIKDLKRSLAETAYNDLDQALEIMEANADTFSTWKESETYTVFKSLIVHDTNTFDRYFPIKKSRRTFLALKHAISDVQDEFLLAPLGKPTLDLLLGSSDDDIIIQTKKIFQKAVVALSIAHIADTTTFELTDAGLFYRWEELPGEKTKLVPDKNLQLLKEQKYIAGKNFLKQAMKLIKDNQDKFPDYTIPEESYEIPIQRFQSGLGL